jgi:hypothetical protein
MVSRPVVITQPPFGGWSEPHFTIVGFFVGRDQGRTPAVTQRLDGNQFAQQTFFKTVSACLIRTQQPEIARNLCLMEFFAAVLVQLDLLGHPNEATQLRQGGLVASGADSR